MSENVEPSLLAQSKSSKMILPSLAQLESQLQQMVAQMTSCQKCGDYTKAQKCKQTIEQLKKQLHQKKLQELNSRHRREKRKMEKALEEQLKQLNTFWDKKIEQNKAQTTKLKQQMQEKHSTELMTTRSQLQTQLPNKMKQSSECLNFRKKEQQMAKQKKYVQAHKIQQWITQLEKKQKEAFDNQRQKQIETGLTQLKNKQKGQIQALIKRTKTAQCQIIKEKQIQIQRLTHKYSNVMKQLKSSQQKQVLAHKGQIKNKPTLSQVTSRSKLVPLKIN